MRFITGIAVFCRPPSRRDRRFFQVIAEDTRMRGITVEEDARLEALWMIVTLDFSHRPCAAGAAVVTGTIATLPRDPIDLVDRQAGMWRQSSPNG